MAPELSFSRSIHTSVAAPALFPDIIETVEQAIECVQELPPAVLKQDRWRPVSLALWHALDFPQDTGSLADADRMLCSALEAEGWLGEKQPL